MGLAHSSPVSEGAKLQLALDERLRMMSSPIGMAAVGVVPEAAQSGNWYALYTCPRHEKRVAEQIEQRHISCFLPLYRSVRRWKDRRKELELALFPGYVFVRIAPQNRLHVLKVPGVVRLVTFNGLPSALPESEIESLRRGLAGHVSMAPHPYLQVG